MSAINDPLSVGIIIIVALILYVAASCRIWEYNPFKKRSKWEYGMCEGRKARRHKRKGNVQFVLWKAGEQGHKEDFWINFDSSWWQLFIPDKSIS